ncbi:DNA-3-methyladenine glycosylase, partial [Candidatus Giovannonibacteria bacterium]|nr:DNA-3-methyladenine glycosylase [Candidatus Giovannonibacteria bacterium]
MVEMVNRSFFQKPTLGVAAHLIGKRLVRKYRSRLIKGVITETEAYRGPNDKASHASRGRTKRTEVMFGEPGTIYVYLIYGMYYCLNIVTE